MAARLETLARGAAAEAAVARARGEDLAARAAHDRAEAARRAAAILRAGPAGVRDLLAS
jgi:hypothetical protein